MKTFLVQGVPMRLQQDGWWLSPPSEPEVPKEERRGGGSGYHAVILLALIALSDILVWDVAPGLGWAVLGLSVFAAAVMLFLPVDRARLALASGGAVLAVLPIIEQVQVLSVLCLLAGLPVSLAILSGRRIGGMVRYWWAGPLFSVLDFRARFQSFQPPEGIPSRLYRSALIWALPLGVGAIFASLLLSANPVLQSYAFEVPRMGMPDINVARILFWLGLGLILWPAIVLHRFAKSLSPDARPLRQGPRHTLAIVNSGAILRSLVLFNILFALQNGLDLAFLAGGVRLPEGMSYATYAHQGAYPLLVLALLSGGFALLARPFTAGSRVVRALLLIWLAQTMWLAFSSGLRLELYVQTYGLTRLRLAAALWIGLVVLGLGLTLWQIGAGRSNAWMLRRAAISAAVTVYLALFVSFDAAIARYNLQNDIRADRHYLCGLSAAAAPVIFRETGKTASVFCHSEWRYPSVASVTDWREWGFRNARARRSLEKIATGEAQP